MNRDNGQGMFTMEFIKKCEHLSFTQVVTLAREVVDQSTATDVNKAKAHAMIGKMYSHSALLQGMVNFSLKHQGLGVIPRR